jgi:hypothetical protein
MMGLFAGFASAHGTHGVPTKAPGRIKWAIKDTAVTVRKPVTVELWQQHLDGKRPLGVITIREDGMVTWGSIDYDVYDENLLELIDRVEKLKLPLLPCRSKSGGLHLFLFMKDWTAASFVQSVLADIAAQLGIAGSEIFPRQTQVLVERGDMGNWMVMPYYGDTYEGKIKQQVGLKRTGAEMSVTEFLITAEKLRVGEEEMTKLVRKRGSGGPSVRRGRSGGAEPDKPFGDGPPCCETLAEDGVPAGYQNNTLFHMGVYYKRKYPTEWREKLEEAGRTFLTPPATADSVVAMVKQLEKKEYEYTCKTEPMASHCNSALCRSRQYGVGDEGAYPVINSVAQLMTEPPVWFVSVVDRDGADVRIEATSAELQRYDLFSRLCMDKTQQAFCSMAQKDWLKILNAAFAKNVEKLPVPDEAGETGQFRELLGEFLTNRQKGETAEDLLTGRPWYDPESGRYYFRFRDLHSFLWREGMREPRAKIMQRLYDKYDKHALNVKGRCVRCLSVPTHFIEPAMELTPRIPEGSVI